MGCCLSCRSPPPLKNIRVVHLNGYVEDFENPVTVSQVTGKPPKHFVCTRAQLLSPNWKPLKPDTQLEPGHLYFLLPFSAFQSDASPMDLANAVNRLTAIAKTTRFEPKSPRNKFLQSSPGTSPNRFLQQSGRVEPDQIELAAYGVQKSCRARSWKPILDTIREKSFTRKSESDLQQDANLEMPTS